MIDGRALHMEDLLKGQAFDAIVFFPPYANHFDYFKSMKVELWFGGFVRNYEELRVLRKRSMRSHLGADYSREAEAFDLLERSQEWTALRVVGEWASQNYFETQKTYVSGTSRKVAPAVAATFRRALFRAIEGSDLLQCVVDRSCRVAAMRGSATQMPLPNSSVDLIATSPPYLDSVDYMYNVMLEYFWLGRRLGPRSDYNGMRRRPIGSKAQKRNTNCRAHSKVL